jgi:hypothetical protein
MVHSIALRAISVILDNILIKLLVLHVLLDLLVLEVL